MYVGANPMCVLVYVVICVLERKSVLVSVHVLVFKGG